MLHKFSFALLFAVLTCEQIASAEVSQKGKCPVATPPKQFYWPGLKGVWFEHARYDNDFEAKKECVYQVYASIKNDTFNLRFSALDLIADQRFYFYGICKILKPGLFFFTGGTAPNLTYVILGVEYKSWMVIYNCEQAGEYRKVRAWILTRERFPNEQDVRKAKDLMVKNGVPLMYLQDTRQMNCPRW